MLFFCFHIQTPGSKKHCNTSPHHRVDPQRLFIDSLLLTFHKLFPNSAIRWLSIASRRWRRLEQRTLANRASGQRGERKEQGMEAEKERLLRDESGVAGDWESGAMRVEEAQGPV